MLLYATLQRFQLCTYWHRPPQSPQSAFTPQTHPCTPIPFRSFSLLSPCRWPSLPLLVLCLLWLHLPQTQAFYGVEVNVKNDCKDTVKISLNDGNYYTLVYGQSYTWTLCSSWCTGFLGASETYEWSYYAYSSDCPSDGSWSQVSSSGFIYCQ